ncbi:MAG TPA: hypothetical protein VM370_10745 [Candidatus Thermoplasmatota archaeon]|nr:hypothetical protein [Candidatus Thermoplasmatota archaeon]
MRTLLVALLLAAPLAAGEADIGALVASLRAQGATTLTGAEGAPAVPADVGYAVRTEDLPCYVAALLTVFEVTTDGVPRDGIEIERTLLAPEPVVPCGYGFESWVGEARATVAPDAWDWVACTAFEGGLGGWAAISAPCHVADFSEVTLTGRVGVVRLSDCSAEGVCVTMQQVFGGTNNAPGHADAASIRIA